MIVGLENTYTYAHAHTHIHIHIFTYIYTHIHMHMHILIYKHASRHQSPPPEIHFIVYCYIYWWVIRKGVADRVGMKVICLVDDCWYIYIGIICPSSHVCFMYLFFHVSTFLCNLAPGDHNIHVTLGTVVKITDLRWVGLHKYWRIFCCIW